MLILTPTPPLSGPAWNRSSPLLTWPLSLTPPSALDLCPCRVPSGWKEGEKAGAGRPLAWLRLDWPPTGQLTPAGTWADSFGLSVLPRKQNERATHTLRGPHGQKGSGGVHLAQLTPGWSLEGGELGTTKHGSVCASMPPLLLFSSSSLFSSPLLQLPPVFLKYQVEMKDVYTPKDVYSSFP